MVLTMAIYLFQKISLPMTSFIGPMVSLKLLISFLYVIYLDLILKLSWQTGLIRWFKSKILKRCKVLESIFLDYHLDIGMWWICHIILMAQQVKLQEWGTWVILCQIQQVIFHILIRYLNTLVNMAFKSCLTYMVHQDLKVVNQILDAVSNMEGRVTTTGQLFGTHSGQIQL